MIRLEDENYEIIVSKHKNGRWYGGIRDKMTNEIRQQPFHENGRPSTDSEVMKRVDRMIKAGFNKTYEGE